MNSVRFIQVEPTTRCNFQCDFCCGRSMEQGDIEDETFENILQTFPEISHMELQGEGEPLLHKHFFRMAKRAHEENIAVSSITNGSLLTEETVEKIFRAHINTLYISIDSADPLVFRKIRKWDLNSILKNIQYLKEKRNEKHLQYPVIGIAVVILKKTMGGFTDILRLYEKLGLDGGLIVQPLQKMNTYTMHYSAGLQKQLLSTNDMDTLEREFKRNDLFMAIICNRSTKPNFYEKLYTMWNPLRDGCPWLKQGMYVNSKGYTLPCCKVKDIKKFSFGKIGIDTRKSIEKKRNNLNKKILNGVIPRCCRGCSTVERITSATGSA